MKYLILTVFVALAACETVAERTDRHEGVGFTY